MSLQYRRGARLSRSFLLVTAPLGGLAIALLPRPAAAATLMVGPGQTYTTPCAAIAAASPNDEIDIAAGTYTDTCTISTAGLHLKGVGGQPKIDVTGEEPAGSKGVYAIEADNVTIENLELTGAQISAAEGENGAGLRIQSNGVVVTHCYIHDNQDGILAGPVTGDGTGTLTVEHSEFSNNGLGNGCNDGNGCTHNLYINKYAQFIFQFNYTHSVGVDSGHLLKSRAFESDILYNRITGEMGDDSYEVDLPNGGLSILVGNVIEKGPNSGNKGTSLIYGDPGDGGYGAGMNLLYLANNTFVNDSGSSSTTFVNVGAGGGMLAAAHDNIFSGMGTVSNTGALSVDNLSGVDPLFVNPATYDYHLQATSPAIGKGVAQGSAGAFSLVPVFEYVDPLSSVPRLTAHDLGAFEYGTNVSMPSMDAGISLDGTAPGEGGTNPDAGAGDAAGAGDSSMAGGNDAGSDSGPGASDAGKSDSGGARDGGSSPAKASSGGCGCAVVGRRDEPALGLLGAGLVLGLVRSRRRPRASPGRS